MRRLSWDKPRIKSEIRRISFRHRMPGSAQRRLLGLAVRGRHERLRTEHCFFPPFVMHRAIPIFFWVLLSGCVTSRPRPADWPADVAVTAVQQVEGLFEPAGALARMIEAQEAAFDRVRIGAEGDSLSFEFTLPDGSPQKVLRRYQLADGWVVVGDHDGTNREGVVGYEKHTFALRPDTTGALIVRTKVQAVGIMLMLPVAGTEHGWARLEKVSPNAPPPVLSLTAADLETVAHAWRANFGEAAAVSNRAKALGVRVDISARTRGEFRRKTIEALRAKKIVIAAHPDGALFAMEGDEALRRK